MPDSVAGDTTTTATLAVGSSIDVTIDTSGDHDWYRVNLVAGQRYSITANVLSDDEVDSYLRLRDSTGTQIAFDDDGGAPPYLSEIHFTATATGTYYIDAGTYTSPSTGASSTGDFTLRIENTAASGADTVAGNTGTTASIAVGNNVSGTINSAGDHDFYAVTLAAGQRYQFSTNATGATGDADTTLTIRDSSGAALAYNDDSAGTYSGVRFTAQTAGTYYIDVGTFNNGGVGTYNSLGTTGAYNVSVAIAPPLTVYTYDQIALQLTNGYWGGQSHHFNVAPGGTLTFDVSGLTAPAQTLAREALNLWSDVTGIRFSEAASGAQITFDDDGEGANTTASYSGQITTSAHVNVSTQWITDYGTGLNSYSFQTFIHEIGHALGLGHGGNYNGSADYDADALYLNDAWATTIMSYFGENENDYFHNMGFTQQYAVSPMVADDIAVGNLYGANTLTRTGDTVYGFNNNSGRAIYDASANPNVSYTVYDNGGIDTLDYSGFSQAQRIDLNPEQFSNVGGRVGNVAIARGSVIENAIGGGGTDVLIGNGVANTLIGGGGADTMTGGLGNDIFRGTSAGLNGDTITDLSAGDRINVSDAAYGSFSFIRAGASLSFGGNTVNVGSPNARLVLAAGASGGTDLVAANRYTGVGDFDGNGHTDLLWRNTNGTFSTWQVSGNTAGNQFQVNSTFVTGVGTDWRVQETFDFNGDGRSDILWRNANTGDFSVWNGSNGAWAANSFYYSGVGTDWRIAGVGDLNGDGRDDIVWRQNGGAFSTWQSTGTGFNVNVTFDTSVSPQWQIVGLADFNGDGRDDLMWRNQSTGQFSEWWSTGTGFTANNYFDSSVNTSWHIDALADFNGDGRDDILWRHDGDGAFSIWQSTGAGFTPNTYFNAGVASVWQVVEAGDFNDDGRADILWRNTASGEFSTWQSNGNGFDANVVFQGGVGTDWQIQGHDFAFG